MTRIHIRTLAGLRVERDGQEIRELPAQPVRCSLLLYLALERSATRDELIALFWPERDADRARHSLNQTLYELRRRLGEEWIESHGERVEVSPALTVDVLDFMAAVEAGRDEEALALYGGPFLEGSHPGETIAFESWLDRWRSQLARLHRDLCRRLTAARVEQGDAEGALAVAHRWAEMDPLEDEAHHRIIALLAASGRRSQALRHYEAYRELIARELEVEPLERTQELAARLREGAAATAQEPTAVRPPEEREDLPFLSVPSGEARSDAERPAAVRQEEGRVRRRLLTTPRGQGVLLGSLATILVAGMLLLWGGAKSVPTAGSGDESVALDPRGIAVLPFMDLSVGRDQEYFSDGVTEDILAALSKIADLTVISRTSVMQYKGTSKRMRQIGEELGVAHVLEGSVRRAGDRVRITAQLIDARTDAHLWAESYDRELTDIFAIQSEVAFAIAAALRANLTAGERERLGRPATRSLTAYDFYLQGREHYYRFSKSDNERAIELFRRALAADPSYALAYTGLADAYMQKVARFNEGRAWTDSAIARAQRAISLDPGMAEAHKALGTAYMTGKSYREAQAALERAVELNPNLPPSFMNLAVLAGHRGRYDEALRWMRRAEALQPTARAPALSNKAAMYTWLGALERAEEAVRSALALQPEFPHTRLVATYLALAQGRPEQAVERAEQLLRDDPEDGASRAAAGEAHLAAGDLAQARQHFDLASAGAPEGYRSARLRDVRLLLGYVLLNTGERERGLDLVRQARDHARREIRSGSEAKWDRYSLAAAFALLGERQSAYRWLEEAVAAGWTDYQLLSWDPLFETLRGDEQFQRIVARNRAEIERQRARVEREGW